MKNTAQRCKSKFVLDDPENLSKFKASIKNRDALKEKFPGSDNYFLSENSKRTRQSFLDFLPGALPPRSGDTCDKIDLLLYTLELFDLKKTALKKSKDNELSFMDFYSKSFTVDLRNLLKNERRI